MRDYPRVPMRFLFWFVLFLWKGSSVVSGTLKRPQTGSCKIPVVWSSCNVLGARTEAP